MTTVDAIRWPINQTDKIQNAN